MIKHGSSCTHQSSNFKVQNSKVVGSDIYVSTGYTSTSGDLSLLLNNFMTSHGVIGVSYRLVVV